MQSTQVQPSSQTDLDEKRLPSHVAIIMDGNGRWAKEQEQDRLYWPFTWRGKCAQRYRRRCRTWHQIPDAVCLQHRKLGSSAAGSNRADEPAGRNHPQGSINTQQKQHPPARDWRH